MKSSFNIADRKLQFVPKPKLHKNLKEVLRIARYWKSKAENAYAGMRVCADPSHRRKDL